MPRTFLLRRRSPEALHAAEYRYLVSWVELQARRAFGDVVVAGAGEAGGPTPAPGDRILWLGNERLLVTAASFAAMAESIEGGADLVAPTALSGTSLAAQPVYTLRGYEKREEVYLRRGKEEGGSGSGGEAQVLGASPVLLAAAGALVREPRPGEPPVPRSGAVAARVGLYHEFIDYYGETRDDVLPHVPPGVRRVLEVGCGRGVTGALLQRRLGCEVTGVELNPVVAAEAAKHLHRVVSGDVETLPPDELDNGYDLVLALELFEHLVEPERFLDRCRRLLRPGGSILLSVPNVGHWSVVEDLLAGRWDYLPIGLLCYTHLRFFTRRTLEDWLERLGFHRFELIPQGTEAPPWAGSLGRTLELDEPSLATRGFFVRIEVPGPRGMLSGESPKRRAERRAESGSPTSIAPATAGESIVSSEE